MADMREAGVERNVSLKLTQLGLRLDADRAFLKKGNVFTDDKSFILIMRYKKGSRSSLAQNFTDIQCQPFAQIAVEI